MYNVLIALLTIPVHIVYMYVVNACWCSHCGGWCRGVRMELSFHTLHLHPIHMYLISSCIQSPTCGQILTSILPPTPSNSLPPSLPSSPSSPSSPLLPPQMLEQLNQTLNDEKTMMLEQMNKVLAQNHELLTRTLDSKDQAIEEERIFK